jgi:hypothetical protein
MSLRVCESQASNLVTGDTNNNYDVFMADRQAATIRRVSRSASGAQMTYNSTGGVSHDGATSVIDTDQPLTGADTNTYDDGYCMTTGR